MKRYYKVSFQYSEYTYCANIAHADNIQDVEKHYSKYAWSNVTEATEYDVEEAKTKGMPIIEIESTQEPEEQNQKTTTTEEKENKTMMSNNMIDLEALRIETREDIGTDAAYLAADYEGCSSSIDDAIRERADSETSIYYSDIIKFIADHVEEVNDTINEFGWDGCGGDLYKAGQMTECLQLEQNYMEKVDGIIRYAAIMDLIYNRKLATISAETWESIESELDGLDYDSRFDEITDVITEALTAEDDTEAAGSLDDIRDRMRNGFENIAAAVSNAETAPETVTA